MVLPPVSQAAVPTIELPPRPELTPFSDEEMGKIPIPAHGKILANQADWWGYADIMEGAIKTLQNYIRRAFKIDGSESFGKEK